MYSNLLCLAIIVLALLMRTKGVPWGKFWQRAALDASGKAVCSLIPLISI